MPVQPWKRRPCGAALVFQCIYHRCLRRSWQHELRPSAASPREGRGRGLRRDSRVLRQRDKGCRIDAKREHQQQ
jgi:hypothetical protein